VIKILAYFDPGSGSLLIQTLVGGLAGLVVFGKYLWNAFADRFWHPDQVNVSPDAKSLSPALPGETPAQAAVTLPGSQTLPDFMPVGTVVSTGQRWPVVRRYREEKTIADAASVPPQLVEMNANH